MVQDTRLEESGQLGTAATILKEVYSSNDGNIYEFTKYLVTNREQHCFR